MNGYFTKKLSRPSLTLNTISGKLGSRRWFEQSWINMIIASSSSNFFFFWSTHEVILSWYLFWSVRVLKERWLFLYDDSWRVTKLFSCFLTNHFKLFNIFSATGLVFESTYRELHSWPSLCFGKEEKHANLFRQGYSRVRWPWVFLRDVYHGTPQRLLGPREVVRRNAVLLSFFPCKPSFSVRPFRPICAQLSSRNWEERIISENRTFAIKIFGSYCRVWCVVFYQVAR